MKTKMSTVKANNGDPSICDTEPADNDEYYLHSMAEILDAFPKSGPPAYPTRLSEHLYIGNQDNADDAHLLSALDITHVLNMAGTRTFDLTRSPYKPESGIRSFLMIPAEDYEEYDILPYLLEAIAFLSRAETSGGCAFVHCNYGVNRSGVVAAAYLMVSERKPLLQVVNELKAKRSLILSNVGFRRQLVRFARCRGLLDPVERPSSRCPRLEPGERTPRNERTTRDATPSKDKTKNGTEDEPGAAESEETGTAKEPPEENGDVPSPPRNDNHVSPAAPTVSMDPVPNGLQLNGTSRPRQTSSHRERLLRDVDSTIEALSIRDGADITPIYYAPYRPREDSEKVSSASMSLYEQPRPSVHLPVVSYTSDPIPGPSVWSSTSHFDILHRPHSPNSEEDFRASSLVGGYTAPSNAVLDEYLQYKRASTPPRLPVPAVLSVRAPPPAAAGQPFISTVKPRTHYSRSSATGSTLLDDYEEANISSFLAERNARRPTRTQPYYAVTGPDSGRRSMDAILAPPRSYSAGKSPGSRAGSYRPSPEFGLPTSAYIGSWYSGSASGRRYSPPVAAGHSSSYVTRMTSFDSDVGDDSAVGQLMSVGRTIATRVTPAPGYGPRSSYARAQSVSRIM